MAEALPQPTPNMPKKGNMTWLTVLAAVLILGLAIWMFWPKGDSDTNTNTSTGTSLANSNTSADTDTLPSDVYAAHAGTWEGTWKNSTFGSTGNLTGTMTVNDDGTAQLVLDVNGNVFGLADPAPLTMNGTYDAAALTFTSADHPVFGDLTLAFASDGNVTGSGLQIPATNIDTLKIAGTVTTTALNLTYTLTAGSATFAEGTIALAKE